jgi:hypothetical protein
MQTMMLIIRQQAAPVFPLSCGCSIAAAAHALLCDALCSMPDPVFALLLCALGNTPGAWHEPARGFSDTNPFGMLFCVPGSCASTAGLRYERVLDCPDSAIAALCCVPAYGVGGSADWRRVLPLCAGGNMPGGTPGAFAAVLTALVVALLIARAVCCD